MRWPRKAVQSLEACISIVSQVQFSFLMCGRSTVLQRNFQGSSYSNENGRALAGSRIASRCNEYW